MDKRRAVLYAIITLFIIFTLTASAPFSSVKTVYTIITQNDDGDVYTATDGRNTVTFTLADVDGFIFGIGQRVTVTTIYGRLDVLAYINNGGDYDKRKA